MQYQPDPTRQPQPTGFAIPSHTPPAPKSRKPLIIAAIAAVAVIMFGTAAYAAYDGYIKEDSGLAACKAMRDGQEITDGDGSGDGEK